MQRNNANAAPALDDYDVEGWNEFYRDHPHYRRAVGADGDNAGGDDGDAGGDGGNDAGGGDGGGEGGDGGAAGASALKFDDDFRKQLAGEDEKRLNVLNRFTSFDDFAKSYFEAQDRIRSGDVLKPLPENATEDDIKAYREQQGIPEDPAAYLENLPDGLVIGDDDKPVMEEFAKALHEVHAPPAMVHAAIGFYNELVEKGEAERQEEDKRIAGEMEEALREEWGKDYRGNINRMNALLESSFGAEQMEQFRSARSPDGTPLLSQEAIVKGLLGIARTVNPAGHLVDSSGDPDQSINDEIAKIEKLMKEDRKAYNADKKLQDRYLSLLEAQSQRKQRGQAA